MVFMESPLFFAGKNRLKSTLPAVRAEWRGLRIVMEINGVEKNCTPQHGWHANSSFAGQAAEPVAK
jgi:hypothetical protein